MQRFVIRGTRGSTPASGPEFARYGGNTTCHVLETDEGIIVFDAGTGIVPLGEEIMRRPRRLPVILMLTHLHLDHIAGLPAFRPIYANAASLRIIACRSIARNWIDALKRFFAPPFWPVALGAGTAPVTFETLPDEGPPLKIWGVTVSWCRVPHTGPCFAYRVDTEAGAIAVATDHEFDRHARGGAFPEFCRGAEVLVHDAQLTPDESRNGDRRGHGSWEDAAAAAAAAGVDRLVLTHHAAQRPDAEIDRLVAEARRVFPNVSAAADGMIVELRRGRRTP